jgi:hypothetical protein
MSEQPKPKILTRLRIDEISLVDRGAGEGCKIVISKRDDSADNDANVYDTDWYREQAAIAERQNEEHLRKNADEPEGRFLKYFLRKSPRGDEAEGLIAEPADVVDNDGDDDGVPKKHRSITFDTIAGERMKFPDERSLAEWLAIQSRIRKSTEDHPTMSINFSDVVKSHGIALFKHMVSEGTSFGLSEEDVVKLATEHAQRAHPGDRGDVAFAKMFSATDEAGATLRAAVEVAKNASLQDAVTAELEKDSREAMEELTKIGKARWPNLNPSQRFARAFETHPELARRAHRRPGPSTSFAHPVTKMPERASLEPRVADETNVGDPNEALAQLREIGRQKWPTESEAESFFARHD